MDAAQSSGQSDASTSASLYCIGEHLPAPNQAVTDGIVNAAHTTGYDIISTYITNINFKERVEEQVSLARGASLDRITVPGLDVEEVNVHPTAYIPQCVAFTSSWLELDSPDPLTATVHRQVLHHELAYAAFCGFSMVVVQGPAGKGRDLSAYAQAINGGLAKTNFFSVLLQFHLGADSKLNSDANTALPDHLETWDAWNSIRTVCNYNLRLSVALQIPLKLPPSFVLDRWYAEPIKVLMIPSSSFVLNAKGFPVMTKPSQALLAKYTKLRPYVFLCETRHAQNSSLSSPTSRESLVKDEPLSPTMLDPMSPDYAANFPSLAPGPRLPHGTTKRRDDPQSYLFYIRHLHRNLPPPSTVELYGAGYQDYLQAPLQPLAHNLESVTYEVFEKDPVKYNQYEKAVQFALDDRMKAGETSTVIAVVGAGRGPLVSRCINASAATGMPVTLYAVEKNPNAYVTLLRHNRDTWGGIVTVVKSDMRDWNPPQQIDIIVSELLGSFGDNELSPECLDGVQRVLKPDTGISIPTTYTAHYSPILTPKIHGDLMSRLTTAHNSMAADILECPWVVMLTAFEHLSRDEDDNPDIKCAWEFRHPLPQEIVVLQDRSDGNKNEHNERESKGTFKIRNRGVIHGIAGYFESILYESPTTGVKVELSTRPDQIDEKSKDMTSWFPIYFPLKTPLYVPDNSEVDVSFWRITDGRKVWYEWMAETFFGKISGDQTQPEASSVRIRLGTSDLCSSKKNGCLMH